MVYAGFRPLRFRLSSSFIGSGLEDGHVPTFCLLLHLYESAVGFGIDGAELIRCFT